MVRMPPIPVPDPRPGRDAVSAVVAFGVFYLSIDRAVSALYLGF